jgi:hypothetical protein
MHVCSIIDYNLHKKQKENGNHVKDQLDDGADDHAHTQLKNFVEND